ncbi:uncharacterized protein UMAG_10849 [Mycosarcoma maydis]|uniref:Uncharacterized protein n=1 Tax=Mycosarcoma maydis TaxID=5270 RepID=A0A0D1DQV8_MYCMD|nr:uncharacterized protein UMAG_10849 [Ustilago maydis 521]KIS66789.1 hypothetical protein UMAG_10849 [Ustilago maydis 521]|eukprot:XP_011391757.1 hypothetical protein UMAG_10849 [Ustilago maydis 521]
MSEQLKWSSSRVAQQRSAQPPSAKGTQQSRWATNNLANTTATSSHTGTAAAACSSSTSSSWRSARSDNAAASSSVWRTTRQEVQPQRSKHNANTGSSTSRWASSACATGRGPDGSIATLTDTLSHTSLASQRPCQSTHGTAPTPSQRARSISRNDGLSVRDHTRPLGGKPLDRLELLASPSRGLDSHSSLCTDLSMQGSMDLTSASVQLELRQYIGTRITTSAMRLVTSQPRLRVLDSDYYVLTNNQTQVVGAAEEELQQILLLVRKLREALVASKRIDAFAVEVYELSTYLALLCADVPQLIASLPRLVNELYPLTDVKDDQEVGSDVRELTSHLGLATHAVAEHRRMRIVSLHLLQILCLGGRATRLGQYTKDSTRVLEPLYRGLQEYRMVKQKLLHIYVDLHEHVPVCDAAYKALRDIDPFRLSSLLHEERQQTAYSVDAWQRLVLLQIVEPLRNAAWAVARRAYLQLPVDAHLKHLIESGAAHKQDQEQDQQQQQQQQQHQEDSEGGRFLSELLLLDIDVFPRATSEHLQENKPTRNETPDEWDADDNPDTYAHPSSHIQQHDLRLDTFLTTQFDSSLASRLTSTHSGHAIKLR